jgi:hypothetical protein
MNSLQFIKRLILKTGYQFPNKTSILINILQSGRVLKKFINKKILRTRLDLYKYLNNDILKNGKIDYLEFGVYQGHSIGDWIKLNTNKSSRFVGFDSFTGLPSDWTKLSGTLSKGYFTTYGEIPLHLMKDERVKFIKGFYQETLDPFLDRFEFRNQLVINIDADLYTSTLYVLTILNKHIHPDTIIIFDEFTSGDECGALIDYSDSYLREYEVIAAAGKTFQQVAIKIRK